jgi:hypothetical protein
MAAHEPDCGGGLFVCEDVDVGCGVIDLDLYALPADLFASVTTGVDVAADRSSLAGFAGEAMTGAIVDPAELLDAMCSSSPGRTRS